MWGGRPCAKVIILSPPDMSISKEAAELWFYCDFYQFANLFVHNYIMIKGYYFWQWILAY